jgi:hypothetical protein
MGEYVEQAERLNNRPTFLGGRCNDMALTFSSSIGWKVQGRQGGSNEDLASFLFKLDSEGKIGTEALPHLGTTAWTVNEQRKYPSSVRVEKFKKRETMLKLSGGQGFKYGAVCEGIYRKQDRLHDSKPTYRHGDDTYLVIWFRKGFGWCVGVEEDIGTRNCILHADNLAPTPDAVQSGWMVRMDSAKDLRVQVVLASAVCTSSSVSTSTLPAAPEHTLPPLTVAVVGVGEGYSGLYEKQQHTHGGKVLYKASRADGNRVIFYDDPTVYNSEADGDACWCIGPISNNDKFSTVAFADDTSASPLTIEAAWNEPTSEPCSSIRVTKSKKKHTKVIEVKGVPGDGDLNGKYRQQALKIDGRQTFKGGNGGNHAIWYSERAGSWRIGPVKLVGTAVYGVHAKDTASMPNTVKSTWEVVNGVFSNPYANIILPTVEAVEQEVPRQMTLKMTEVVTTERKRCLCCGHQYTSQTELVYHDECMHHHCVCCEQDQDSRSCAVCAQQEEEG